MAAFEARHSPEGLILRYAHGRQAHFVARQVLTVVGSLALAILVSPHIGILVLSLALLGEGVDWIVLRQVPNFIAKGWEFRRIEQITGGSAAFQALTIAACVLFTLLALPDSDPDFFALAFLSGAAMDAGLAYPFHPLAARFRLWIYAGTCCAFLNIEFALSRSLDAHHAYNFLAVSMMIYMVRMFLTFTIRSFERNLHHNRELLQSAWNLEIANSELHDTQREARQLSLVARHANDSVVISGLDGAILWTNAAFTRITGYSAAEAKGCSIGDLLNGPETSPDTIRSIREANSAGQPIRSEILNYRKDGQQIWIDSNSVPVRGEDGAVDVVVAIERNVTDAKEHARQLADAMHKAQDAARAKAAFLATMSHEIRTPMNGIIGMADLLSDADLSEEHRQYPAIIRTSAGALLKIIDDILDYSKLGADKMRVESTPFCLAACIRDAAQVLRSAAREKKLYLDISHDSALPDPVLGDAGRLRQILINLLGNAVKFTTSGGVTLRVTSTPEAQGYRIDIRVTDTGFGVAPENAERIFEQFEQVDTQTTRAFGGTGLGLAISRELAQRMGGDLSLDVDHVGPGAAFALRFRVGHTSRDADAAGQTTSQPAVSGTRYTHSLAGLRLLVADDNGTNRLLIERFLKDLQIDLSFACDGHEVLGLEQELRPDVILMDISMPGLDGLAATRVLRARQRPQPRIVALTANAFESDRVACLAAGMDDFLSKPVRRSQLIEALHRNWRAEKPLGTHPPHDVSRHGSTHEASQWISQPVSGTINGKSTRSSGP
ncbi:PAS domain-containing hybrid sensor histidine kinase/response regulator [Puniceibacterium sp. IMCC21224]|uniref:PAS domain-containing hybrid sensor histidine kinase/response regulator n=1 Tax=Puniceibacterium sp. IMCC21224 TaxID=1618204 RepID=UPI00065DA0F3|nr:PAS domain-containing hybrid sensor histidine kinase/response regulator [Puniceibacterium sp. IMCC21224]KMK65898.1 PAS/PAC sensor hybrid histidine kinase [Puniceibacterium sp. IMCC21224]